MKADGSLKRVIRSSVLDLLMGLGVPLGALVALDHLWLRLGQSVWLEAVVRVVWVAAAVASPVVFWRLFRRSLPGSDTPSRWAAGVVLTVVCSLAWFYFAFSLLVNIHLAMGGQL